MLVNKIINHSCIRYLTRLLTLYFLHLVDIKSRISPSARKVPRDSAIRSQRVSTFASKIDIFLLASTLSSNTRLLINNYLPLKNNFIYDDNWPLDYRVSFELKPTRMVSGQQ